MNTRNEFHFFKITALAILLWLTGFTVVFPQDYIFDVEIINVEDGLPHRNTYGIIQDKEGFIWLSTLRGISRYDGYNFKNYDRHLLNIPETLAANYLAVDAQNRIWYSGAMNRIGLYSGLIDPRSDSIYKMESISGGRFTSEDVIYLKNSKVNKDHIIIVTRDGVIYNYDGDFHEIYRAPRPFTGNVLCQAFPDGSYWLIQTINPTINQSEVFRIEHGKILQQLKVDHWIKRIVTSYPELIVETPHSLSATQWKLEKDHLVPFSIKGYAPEDMRELLQLHQDYICYTTGSELLVQDKQDTIIYRFDQFEFLYGKAPNSMNTLLDRQGILWVTTTNGIIKLNAQKNPFKNLGITNNIKGIYRDGPKLWAGKTVTDLKSGLQTTIPPGRSLGISTFYKDRQGHLWLGTGTNFIIRYILGEDRYIQYNYDGLAFFHLVFQNTITKTRWLGTKNGLFRFDANTEKITPFTLPIASKGVYIRQFYQNTKGIWIVTDKGIFLMNAQKENIVKHYTTASGLAIDNINHLYEDDRGIFWLGTKGSGLLRWDLATNGFRQYSRDNGLSNDNIYAVYEDDYETLWLPSDYGLMAFDKNAETAKVYLPKHGISHEEFNTFSHFRDEDGTFYFGGLKGITSFHPRDLQRQTAASPPLHATRVRVLEKDAETYTDKTGAFTTAKKIVLNPNDRILELELTLLDYEKSAENQYAYKLEGKQEQWIYTRENKLSIINPPYGKYNLEIKARGASGSWSETPLVIPMQVQPPFYMQWWFILSSVLVTIAVIVIAVRWRIRKLEKDRKRLEQEVEKRTWKIEQDKQTIEQQAEDLKVLDKAKTRFFSNITHEFRTPLTLLIGPIEQIKQKPPSPSVLSKRLGSVLKNAYSLLDLINQLLDISKLEGGKMKLEISHGDIIRYTKSIISRFQPLIEKKKFLLDFKTGLEQWKIHFDRDKWDKIVVNLLSNAVKFTPENGRINIILDQSKSSEGDCIHLEISDTGMGIDAAHIDHVFDRFYQVDDSSTRVQGGTGIGLALVKELLVFQGGDISVESKVGEGTVFRVKLPVLKPVNPEEVSSLPLGEVLPMPAIDELWPEEDTEYIDETEEHQNKSKLKLLIIEDHREMIAYIRSCIDASTYEIYEALNGEEGIKKAQDIVPDLIISDIMMPKKDGFEVTRTIRNNLATSHIPLILLTAKASLESRLKGISRGADAYLTKPFNPEELNLRIKKLIALRRLLQERYSGQELPETAPEFEKEDAFITQLRDHITAHLSDSNLDGDSISKHFFMSRMQLYRKISTLTDHTLGEFIRSIRLETAKKLIEEGELNIAEIAYETGFSSPAHFSRTFKSFYGKSPSQLK